MRAANLALVIVANMASASLGAFLGGFTGSVTHSAALGGLLSLLGMPASAYALGIWAARRQYAPTITETRAGCSLYIAACLLLAFTSRHHYAILFSLLGGGLVSYCFYKGRTRGETLRQSETGGASVQSDVLQSDLSHAEEASVLRGPAAKSPARVWKSNTAIQICLGLTVITLLGFFLSSFSWMRGDQTTSSNIVIEQTSYLQPQRSPATPTPPENSVNPEQHVVHGHYLSDGKYVAPYVATNPDHDKTNNLSSPGNKDRGAARRH